MQTEPTKARRRTEPDPQAPSRIEVLVVEDEQDLQELLAFNLQRHGFEVRCAATGEEALAAVGQHPPGVVLLDLMLPGMDGLEVCRALRSDASTADLPIIMLTARGEEADVVAGLELGADDYVTKPFSPRVLLARLKAVLRRRSLEQADHDSEPGDHVMQHGEVVIDPQRHEVRVAGQRLDLTVTEFRLLALLASRPGRVFTRQQVITNLHGALSAVTDRSVDVQVLALRRKLGEHAELVETVRGVGYRFKD